MNSSRTKSRSAALAALTLIVAACDPATGPVPPLTELPRPLTAAEREIIASSNGFAFDLLREVNREEASQNVFLSPLSVSMALGMTMNGAAGATFDEIRRTLGFGGLSQAEINDAYRTLIALLLGLDRTVEMAVANSVWYRREFPFEQDFFSTVRTHFDAEVEGLDFGDPASVQRVNAWVERATNGRIDEILKSISPRDVMYLINAIYFKGTWTKTFDRARTQQAVFHGLGGASLPVRMMSTKGTFRYGGSPEWEAVDLPYGNGAFTMTIVLPRADKDVNAFLTSLDEAAWERVLAAMSERELDVEIPRFRLEYEKSLNDVLMALGIEAAFDDALSDFTPLSRAFGRDLYISSVKHKTFVQVDEQGTEAAAVTKVTVGLTSAPPSFRADRPFVFAIRERFSGTILFTGKIVEPGDFAG